MSPDTPRSPDSGEAETNDVLLPLADRLGALLARHPAVESYEVRTDLREIRGAVLHGGAYLDQGLSRVSGVSARVFFKKAASYGFTTDLTGEGLAQMIESTVRNAGAAARHADAGFAHAEPPARRLSYRPALAEDPVTAEGETLRALLARATAAAEAKPGAIASASFGASRRLTHVFGPEGLRSSAETLLTTLFVDALSRDAGKAGRCPEYASGEYGIGDYEGERSPETLGSRALQHAEEVRVAEAAPAGRMRVLIDNDLAGLLAHESFGHLTEYDLVSSGWSILRDRIGETLAAPTVTICDAPFVPGDPRAAIRVPVDEEGVPGREVAMLERGVLREYLHQFDTATSMDAHATGNGRALDIRHPPIVRMRNTYFRPGEMSVDEALAELGDGVYLCGARAGVTRSDGGFMFTANHGYRVEGGEIRASLRPVSLHGNILDYLKGVEALTRDFRVQANVFGGCGKGEQSFIHVGMGGPHVLVSGALVGGDA
ncbi:MAG: TldD/PmbA family protein [Thermoplasmatota archaeon]